MKKDIVKIKDNILRMLYNTYGNIDNDIKLENIKLLNEGEYLNATVFRYKSEALDLTIKDFSGCPWFIKNTMGKIFVNREGKFLNMLEDNPAITKNIKLLSPYTISFDFVKGRPLKVIQDMSVKKEAFLELEENLKKIHEKDLVHLDLRNVGNIIEGEDKKLYIIDFQSCISVKYFPNKLKEILKKSDISGIYKCWLKKSSDPLGEEREEFLEEFKKFRKLWVFRGYPLKRLKKKLQNNFPKK